MGLSIVGPFWITKCNQLSPELANKKEKDKKNRKKKRENSCNNIRCHKKEMELSLVTVIVEELVVLNEFTLWLCTIWLG